MEKRMDMRTSLDGGVLTLYPEGYVDSKNAGEFSKETMAAMDAAPGASVVIDMDKLEYLSSAGLRVLMKVINRSEDTVKVVNGPQVIAEIFEITGFEDKKKKKKR